MNSSVKDTANDAAASTRNAIRDTADSMSTAAGNTMKSAGEASSEQLEKMEKLVRANPLAAAGIAAGVGFMIAMLARR
ncbi:MAG: hypothetical protein SH859_11775 [Hyphomicrobium aestuarii]|nr:hypothetical protein [Hyphomicrobium aestuarii]